MSDHLFIDSGQLVTSSYDWREHADTLDGAAERTASASTSGFPDADVIAAANVFRFQWSLIVGNLRDASREFEDKMLAASSAYSSMDEAAQQEFEAWLLSMGERS